MQVERWFRNRRRRGRCGTGVRTSTKKRVFLYLMSAVVAAWLIGPVLWVLNASFQSDDQLFTRPPNWLPPNPTLDNYKYIITRVPPPSYASRASKTGSRACGEALAAVPALKNSLIVAGSTMSLSVIITLFAAYAFSRLRFTGRDSAFGFIMLTRLIPPIAIAIPFFIIIDRLHLLDTYVALIMIYLAFTLPFTIWFLAKYFDFLPPDLEDAALIDGCTRFQAFCRVVIPVTAPGVAAAAAFSFMAGYSEFLFAVLLTKTMASKTVPVVLSNAAINHDVSYALATAAVMLAIVPPIVFALVFRNYITRGMSMAFGK